MLFKNGITPGFFKEEQAKKLDEFKILKAVNSFTPNGLKLCAAGYLSTIRRNNQNPKEILNILEKTEVSWIESGFLTPDKSNKNSV